MDMPTNKRTLQKAATRASVIAAAGRVFRQRGYAAATIAVIADEAGVSPGTVLNAAPTKIALLNLVMAEEFEALGADTANLRAGLLGGFDASLATLLELHLNRHYEIQPMIGPLLAECWVSEGDEFEQFYANMDRAWGPIRDLLVDAREAGALRKDVNINALIGFLQDAYLGVLRRSASDEMELFAASNLLRERIDFVFQPVAA